MFFAERCTSSCSQGNGVMNMSGKILIFISIVILCLFAALRSPSVGIDVSIYVTPNWNKNYLQDFYTYYNNMLTPTEIGFAFILYLGLLLDNLGFSFFLIQFLIIIPIYVLLIQNREKLSISLGLTIYLFLFYNISFSLMRGSIAMSMLLLAYYYLRLKKYMNFLFFCIIAYLFHSSSLLIISLYVLVYLICQMKNRNYLITILFFILGIFYVYANQYAYVIENIVGHVNTRYAYYIDMYMGYGGGLSDVPMTDFLCKSMSIALSWVLLRKSKNPILIELFLLTLMGRFFVLFNGVFYESLRIAYYFDMFIIIIGAMAIYNYKKTINKFIVGGLLLLPSFMYWLHYIMIIGAYQTNVYEFY